MRRTMNVWFLVVLCACVLVGFLWYNQSLSDDLEELNAATSN